MILLSLKYQNLFSLGGGDIKLQARGLTLVTGHSKDEGSSNGAGKSSLANKAILWTLYGMTAGGLKADAAINRHGKRSCHGEINFVGANGQEYKVYRGRGPASLTLHCLAFHEKINGRAWSDVTARTSKETQALIDMALGFDYKTFVQTSTFGQGRESHYPSLPPKEQKAVLEQILPMEEADRWAAYADKQVKAISPKVREAELGLSGVLSEANTIRELLGDCQEDGIRFEEKKARSIQEAKTSLENIKDVYKPAWDSLECDREEAHADTFGVAADLAAEEALVDENQNTLKATRETITKLHHSHRAWQEKINTLTSMMNEIVTDSKCPVCRRDYDDTTMEAVQTRINQQREQIDAAQVELDMCIEAYDYYHKNEQDLLARLAKSDGIINRMRHKLEAKADWDRRRETLVAATRGTEATSIAELKMAEASENPHLDTYKRLETQSADAEAALEHSEWEVRTLKEELEHLKYWRDVFGKELKLKLFEDACPFLDSRTTYHLQRLANRQIHCDFSTVKRLANGDAKEEFNVDVWSETGGRGFEALSGGEQQMVSFAVGLALADLASRVAGSQSGFLILDEPFTELDVRNGEAIVNYLTAEIQGGKDTVFLISNDEALKGLIQNRIHVVKDKGVSNVSTQ